MICINNKEHQLASVAPYGLKWSFPGMFNYIESVFCNSAFLLSHILAAPYYKHELHGLL